METALVIKWASCPTCLAIPNEPCRTGRGRKVEPHKARIAVYVWLTTTPQTHVADPQ